MKKYNNRKEKLELLKAALVGNTTTLRHFQKQQKEVWFLVVTDNGEPNPTDLVETRLVDLHGRKRVPYSEFLINLAVYGNSCITVN